MENVELVIWFSLTALLVGGLAGEYKSTKDVTARVKSTLKKVQVPSINACDIVGNGAQLNAWANTQAAVTWRRNLIGTAILVVASYGLGVYQPRTSRDIFIFVLLTFTVFSSISGYNNYHMRDQVAEAVHNSLGSAMNKLSATQTCDPLLMDTVTMRMKK